MIDPVKVTGFAYVSGRDVKRTTCPDGSVELRCGPDADYLVSVDQDTWTVTDPNGHVVESGTEGNVGSLVQWLDHLALGLQHHFTPQPVYEVICTVCGAVGKARAGEPYVFRYYGWRAAKGSPYCPRCTQMAPYPVPAEDSGYEIMVEAGS